VSSVWSPIGDRILVSTKVNGMLDVFSVTVDGARADNLTKPLDDLHGAGSDFGYGWSSDGKSIVFNRMGTLWTMSADGSNARLLANLPSMQGVVWSPDGSHLLTISTRVNERNADIYLVSAVDGTASPVMLTPTVHEAGPLFSPDGQKIAYSRSEGGTSDVWTVSIDGSSPVNMTPNTPSSSEYTAAWSPDGDTLVISSDREGSTKPFRIPATGGSLQRIVTEEPGSSTSGDDQTFTISPGGGRIFFTRTLPERQGTVVGTARVVGSEVRIWSEETPKAVAGSFSPACIP
jgi:Tol biopolymer transport system component